VNWRLRPPSQRGDPWPYLREDSLKKTPCGEKVTAHIFSRITKRIQDALPFWIAPGI
jgi:hypothetical protein